MHDTGKPAQAIPVTGYEQPQSLRRSLVMAENGGLKKPAMQALVCGYRLDSVNRAYAVDPITTGLWPARMLGRPA
jgi:hypothetical protein